MSEPLWDTSLAVEPTATDEQLRARWDWLWERNSETALGILVREFAAAQVAVARQQWAAMSARTHQVMGEVDRAKELELLKAEDTVTYLQDYVERLEAQQTAQFAELQELRAIRQACQIGDPLAGDPSKWSHVAQIEGLVGQRQIVEAERDQWKDEVGRLLDAYRHVVPCSVAEAQRAWAVDGMARYRQEAARMAEQLEGLVQRHESGVTPQSMSHVTFAELRGRAVAYLRALADGA
jgi:hypothetical protein